MNNPLTSPPKRLVIEYLNLDCPPAYVESAQGMINPNGTLTVSFFAEWMQANPKMQADIPTAPTKPGEFVQVAAPDPYRNDEEVKILRRVEANLIFTQKGLETIIPWLQQKLNEMKTPGAAQRVNPSSAGSQ